MQKVSALGTATARQAPAEARVVEFPGTPERAGRTFVCSVLFLDIVEYSKRPVGEQLQIKERFNAQVSQAIAEVPAQDRIILDTGDGVAISFLDDPEDALRVALALAHWFALPGGIPVRAGINLGPVRLTRDINGQPNIIGDGINVAQRVMSFAQPGQLLVSRAFHEGVSRFADDYAALFSYQGSRTDKHVREHEIFELSAPAGQALDVAERHKRARRREGRPPATAGARLMAHRKLAFGVTAVSLTALGAALIAFLQPDGGQPEEPAAVAAHAPAQPGPMPTTPAAPPAVEPEPAEQPAQGNEPQRAEPQRTELQRAEPQGAEPPPAEQPPQRSPPESTGTPAAKAPARSAPSSPAALAPEPSADPTPPATAALRTPRGPAAGGADADTRTVQAPWQPPPSADPAPPVPATPPVPPTRVRTAAGATALVLLAISPWGEVYVNGKSVGVSPPLAEVELKPGKHRIEVRNGGFKPYQEDMELGSNQTVRIKHKFTHAR
jgi:class 3 adenylate cyclase